MGKRELSGFVEIEHLADWALEVWGPDLEALFQQAAIGMIALMGIELAPGNRVVVDLSCSGADNEGLLVAFLGEILFLCESQHFGTERIQIHLEDFRLEAKLTGGRIMTQRKEIKAVTYHNLVIQRTPSGLQTRIVFDV